VCLEFWWLFSLSVGYVKTESKEFGTAGPTGPAGPVATVGRQE
jgi:hypothetical protein